MDITKELKISKPVASVEEEVGLNILLTGERLKQKFEEVFKGYGLSSSLYNILRILRGAKEQGRTCNEIGERLISREPDVTRLLDNLVKKNLVTRKRMTSDRRVVKSYINKNGLDLLESMSPTVNATGNGITEGFSSKQIKRLIKDLGKIRDNIDR